MAENINNQNFEQEDNFEELFDQAVLGEFEDDDSKGEATETEDKGKQSSSDGDGVSGETDGAGDAGQAQDQDGEGSEEDTGGEEEPTGEGEPEETEEGSIDDEEIDEEEILKDPKKFIQRYKTLQGMWKAQQQKQQQTQPQQQQEPAEDDGGSKQEQPKPEDIVQHLLQQEQQFVLDILSKDDKFKELKEDYPEVATTIENLFKNLLPMLAIKQTANFVNMLQTNVTPFIDYIQQQALIDHYNTIKQAHPDFDSIVNSGQLEAWISQQPPRKQKYYQEIYESGTAEEVIELMNDFKSSLGLGNSPKPQKKTAPKGKVSVDESSKDIEDMSDIPSNQRPVNSGRFQAPKDDFELAFEEALNSS